MKLCLAEFTIVSGQQEAVAAAARSLVDQVTKQEPGTLVYLAGTREDGSDSAGTLYLWMVEMYADDQAFDRHLAKGSPWDRFAGDARDKGWLVTDASSPIGLRSRFMSMDTGLTGDVALLGSLLRHRFDLGGG